MQLGSYEIALIGVGATILGVLLGTWITFRFSLRLANLHSKRLAGIRLRDAFAPEIVKLQHLKGEELVQAPDILEVAFDKHHMAANEFAFFLDKEEAPSFTKAWREYCTSAYEEGTDFYQYRGDRDTAIDRIYAILEFTK